MIVATDVLSEGQNLQDAAIVVNYDLPWAIIRLVQRAGRVDRIGQKAENILCYSFLPADGVERILRLRTRVRQRLKENAEVVGTDEQFFEDDRNEQIVRDLFTENSGILDDDPDTEVDLSSYAYQIWKNAIDRDPALEKAIPALPDVVYSTRPSPFVVPASPVLRQDSRLKAELRTARRGGAGLRSHGPRQRRPRLDRHEWPKRDRVAVCHPESSRVRAGYARIAAIGKSPRSCVPGRAAYRHGREIGRWPAWPALGRAVPDLRTVKTFCRRDQGHIAG